MGYTHYWCRPLTLPKASLNSAAADCARVLLQLGVPLAGADGTGQPRFGPAAIVFNGVGRDSCETFAILPKETTRHGDMASSFCKTNRLPYDIAVQVALIICRHHLGDEFRVRSDGDDAAWEIARQFCQLHLGYGADFKLERV